MNSGDASLIWIDKGDPPQGRFDPARMGKPNPDDTEPRPIITAEDLEATRRLAAARKPSMRKPRA